MSIFNLVPGSLSEKSSNGIAAPPRVVSKASRKDCDQIHELVNQAFKVEIGKAGIAYKKCDKYRLKDAARKHLDDMWVVKEGRKVCDYYKVLIM